VSARRSRHCCCFALCVVRCPTWFQPAGRSFYGHLVSSASGDDSICAGALHPLYARARCSGVVHVGCATRRFRSAAARCALESPAVVHEDTSPAHASRRVRLRAALCAIGTALRHCRSGGRSAASRLRGVATCRVVTNPHDILRGGLTRAQQAPVPTLHRRARRVFRCVVRPGAARRGQSAGERTVPEPCQCLFSAHLGLRSDLAAADGLRRVALGAGVTRVVGACAAVCGVR